jgi:hypothetical protein
LRIHFGLPILDEKQQKNKRPDERENAPRGKLHSTILLCPRNAEIGPTFGHGTIESSLVHHKQESCHVVQGALLRFAPETAETLGIGYAGRGLVKGYIAVPVRLPSGELTGYIGITEAKLPKQFHLSDVVTFLSQDCLGSPPRKCWFLYSNRRGS